MNFVFLIKIWGGTIKSFPKNCNNIFSGKEKLTCTRSVEKNVVLNRNMAILALMIQEQSILVIYIFVNAMEPKEFNL